MKIVEILSKRPQWFIISFISASLLDGCISYNGHMESKYTNLIGMYKINDTVFFRSENNDLDTIKISSIDSMIVKDPGPDNTPMKKISIKIRHLPLNKWNNGIDYNDEILDEELISILKSQISNNLVDDRYSVFIQYRGFFKQYNPLFAKQTDTIFLGTNKHLKNNAVVEMYWDTNKGLVGYKNNDGHVYKVVDR